MSSLATLLRATALVLGALLVTPGLMALGPASAAPLAPRPAPADPSGGGADLPPVRLAQLADPDRTDAPLAQAATVVLDRVHVDVGARVLSGQLQIQIKDGTSAASPVWREPSTVVFHALPASEIALPDNPELGFLGDPGDAIWLLPQVQQAGILWPGWNTEAISASEVSSPITWRLTSVSGPGRVAIFVSGALSAPQVLFNSADGLPDTLTVPLGTHAHGNWAFSAEGVYQLGFEMSATLASGGTSRDTATLAVAVGDVDPSSVTPPPDPGPAPAPGPGSGDSAGGGSEVPAGGTPGGGQTPATDLPLPSNAAPLMPLGVALLLMAPASEVLRRRRDRAGGLDPSGSVLAAAVEPRGSRD